MSNLYKFLKNPWSKSLTKNKKGVELSRMGLIPALKKAREDNLSMIVEYTFDSRGFHLLTNVIDVNIYKDQDAA